MVRLGGLEGRTCSLRTLAAASNGPVSRGDRVDERILARSKKGKVVRLAETCLSQGLIITPKVLESR